MRTPIKYYGGKTRMLNYILPMIPEHRVYVEAFAGGAALFWKKKPSRIEVLNDINGNVANFYATMQSSFQELHQKIQGTLHCENTFNQAKDIYNNPEGHTKVDRAWSLWVCANMSFGGEVGGTFQWVKNNYDNWHPAVSIDRRKRQFGIYQTRLDKVCS